MADLTFNVDKKATCSDFKGYKYAKSYVVLKRNPNEYKYLTSNTPIKFQANQIITVRGVINKLPFFFLFLKKLYQYNETCNKIHRYM